MPSIPLIGGPHDGEKWRVCKLRPEIHIPTFSYTGDVVASPVFEVWEPPKFGRLRYHTYRLSPCGRRYLHTSLVDQN